jgi:hypothetical protein
VADTDETMPVRNRKLAEEDIHTVQQRERRRNAETQREHRNGRDQRLLGEHAEAELRVEAETVRDDSAEPRGPDAPHRGHDIPRVTSSGSAASDAPLHVARERGVQIPDDVGCVAPADQQPDNEPWEPGWPWRGARVGGHQLSATRSSSEVSPPAIDLIEA